MSKMKMSETVNRLLDGEWVEINEVTEALGMNYFDCLRRFDFVRSEDRGENGKHTVYVRVPFAPKDTPLYPNSTLPVQ